MKIHLAQRTFLAMISVASTTLGMAATLALAGAALAPSAGAAPAPSAVKDVSGNSVGSGVLFGGRDEALAVNPVSPNVVLAAVEFGGVWRSNDGGAHWSHVDSLPLTAMDDVEFAAS